MPRTLHGQVRLLVILLLIALAAYLAHVPTPPPQEQPGIGGFYQVMQVFDGDTLSILKDGKRVTVRLIGIDTPEINTPYTKAACFGTEAAAEAKKILQGQTVRI
jgi:micrococcal nuclease